MDHGICLTKLIFRALFSFVYLSFLRMVPKPFFFSGLKNISIHLNYWQGSKRNICFLFFSWSEGVGNKSSPTIDGHYHYLIIGVGLTAIWTWPNMTLSPNIKCKLCICVCDLYKGFSKTKPWFYLILPVLRDVLVRAYWNNSLKNRQRNYQRNNLKLEIVFTPACLTTLVDKIK